MSTLLTTSTGVVHDVTEIVPFVGMAGRYKLKAPFTSLLNEDLEYTCTSVISIAGAIAQGDNPLEDIYKANGATDEAYVLDAANNHCLVTLQSGFGHFITVPNSALVSLPNADGVRYTSMVLGISLSALPYDFNLSSIKEEVSELIFHRLGVRSTAYAAVYGGVALIDHERHRAIEAARLVNITSNFSLHTENDALKVQNAAMAAKIATLETYIKNTLPT